MIDTIGVMLLVLFPPPLETAFVGNIIDNYGLEIHVEMSVKATGGAGFLRMCCVTAHPRGGELITDWFSAKWQGNGTMTLRGGAPYGCRLVDGWVVIRHDGAEIFRMYAPYYEPYYEPGG